MSGEDARSCLWRWSDVRLIRTALATADRFDPVERDAIYTALVADLRTRRPEAVSPMTLGPPTEPLRDPRSGGGR